VVLFLSIWVGQSAVGYHNYNNDQQEHQQTPISYGQYLRSGDFVEATAENWESEFLQMFSYVIFTVFLFQKGSPESRKLIGSEPIDRKPKKSKSQNAPWPVRRGGAWLRVYSHSLSLAFLILFLFSITMHAYGGSRVTCEENLAHGEQQCESTLSYMTTSKFWFESLQNWQSEYLAVFAIVTLSIFLREKGSPESKPVNSPHLETGSE
jgi:succinate dehydrogenase hydrophobic anchor subunit